MKVFLILLSDFWMINHLVPQWKKMAEEVHVFYYPKMADWDTGNWKKIKKDKLAELNTCFEEVKSKIDLVFAVAYDDFLDETFLKTLGSIPIINLHVDADTQWYRLIKTAKYYNLIVFTHYDREVLGYMNRFTKVIYQPMASNPDYFKPLNLEKIHDLVFVGAYNAYRGLILEQLQPLTNKLGVFGGGWDTDIKIEKKQTKSTHQKIKASLDKMIFDISYASHLLKVKGAGHLLFKAISTFKNKIHNPLEKEYTGSTLRPHIHGFLASDKYVKILDQARVVLGINQRNQFVSHRLRDVEVPSIGAVYMPQRFPELPALFEEGEEVVSWSTEEELKQKLLKLLPDQARQKEIGHKARQKVIQTHTWVHRFKTMLSCI